ncbi:helix-turn-helix domain-containing protein [Streptomyces sp. NPDC005722]
MDLPKHPSTSRGRDHHVVAVVVVPDAVTLEVLIAQQVFGPAAWSDTPKHRDPPYEVVLCGEDPRVTLPSGADLGELAPLDVVEDADTVIVPGIENPLAPRSDALLSGIHGALTTGARTVSFCGGAFVLAYAGVLDGRRATTHWLYAEEFREMFPDVRLEPEHLFVDDGPVHTSGGVFSALDLALHLVAEDVGQAYANDLGRLLVTMPHRPGGQSQFVKSSLRADDATAAWSLMPWIQEHLHEPLTLARLAAQEHVSERSLLRKFRRDVGMSVFDWISQERVNRAKQLLETTTFPIADIAAMAGFGSAESLRRNFRKHVGITAGSYRATFRSVA